MPLFRRTWIDHTCQLDASLDTVSALLRDVDGWPDWSPGVVAITRKDSGPPTVGSKFSLRVQMPGSRAMSLPCKVYQWDRERLEWGGGMPGSVIRHSMELTSTGEHGCSLRHVEYATNLLALFCLLTEKSAYAHDRKWSDAIEARFARGPNAEAP